MSKMVQVKLSNRVGRHAEEQLTTWVDADKRIIPGSEVQLKGDPRWWKILEVFDVEQERSVIEANRNWDNNEYRKHEGLGL